MGNYSNQLGLIHFNLITKYDSDIKKALYYIFANDCDFTENADYFRKNTLKLGYINEADRLIQEYMKKNGRIDSLKKVERAVNKLAAKVFDNSTYYWDYQVSVYEIADNEFSVSIAYIS